MPKRPGGSRWASWSLCALCMVPLVLLVIAFLNDGLGANPVEAITHETGKWALRLLLATLAVTPLRRLTGASWLAPHRRTLGLFAFFYASLHFATYLALDLGLDLSLLADDIAERPYITIGFSTFVLLIPLAATSTRAAMRRLGRRWLTLHRLIYVAAIGAIVHFWWLVKADVREPAIHAGVLAALLVMRLPALRSLSLSPKG